MAIIYFEMLKNAFPFAAKPTEESIQKVIVEIERSKISKESKEFFRRAFVMNPKARISLNEIESLFKFKEK